jgi:hypothetical protein
VKSKICYEVSLVVNLSTIEFEEFVVEPNLKTQSLVCLGNLAYPERKDWVVQTNYQNTQTGAEEEYPFLKSLADLYGEQKHIGVLYIKKGGTTYLQKEDILLYAKVPRSFIEKAVDMIMSGSRATLTVSLLVHREFIKDNFQKYTTLEVQNRAEFDDIYTSELATCLVTKIYLRSNRKLS